jgi:hypothetical protein
MPKFFRRHERLISFIGASIVLATFILREIVRDHLKDLADSLDQAQSVFSIRGQLDETNLRLRLLLSHADDQTRHIPGKPEENVSSFQDLRNGIDALLEHDISDVTDLQATQDNLVRLLRKLPMNAYLKLDQAKGRSVSV